MNKSTCFLFLFSLQSIFSMEKKTTTQILTYLGYFYNKQHAEKTETFHLHSPLDSQHLKTILKRAAELTTIDIAEEEFSKKYEEEWAILLHSTSYARREDTAIKLKKMCPICKTKKYLPEHCPFCQKINELLFRHDEYEAIEESHLRKFIDEDPSREGDKEQLSTYLSFFHKQLHQSKLPETLEPLYQLALDDFFNHFGWISKLPSSPEKCMLCDYTFSEPFHEGNVSSDGLKKISHHRGWFCREWICERCLKEWITLRQSQSYLEREEAYVRLQDKHTRKCDFKEHFNNPTGCTFGAKIYELFLDGPISFKDLPSQIKPKPKPAEGREKTPERKRTQDKPADQKQKHVGERKKTPERKRHPEKHSQKKPHRERKDSHQREKEEDKSEIDDTRSDAPSMGTRTMFNEILNRFDQFETKIESIEPHVKTKKKTFWKRFGKCWQCLFNPCQTCMQKCGKKTGQCFRCCGKCLEDCCDPED